MAVLHNKIDKKLLKARLKQDPVKRKTISFYRYIKIRKVKNLRDELYQKWSEMNCLGRIYLADEGINAQMSVPQKNWAKFKKDLQTHREFKNVEIKIGIEDNGKSFYKLTIKVKEKILADGIKNRKFNAGKVGRHLTAAEFNKKMSEHDSVVVDMRNHYESEIGHFEGAICPDSDTFREELPMVKKLLKNRKDKKILLYCTGGIRCEKASAYLKHYGFKKVYQLYGGIINYAHEIKQKKLPSKFIGKNFVFDERMGERITDSIIAKCHQCGHPCDNHTNCANNACHLLFIQCKQCARKFASCCTAKCQKFIKLPIEKQRRLRKKQDSTDSLKVYKSRLRPRLIPQ